MIRRVIEIDKDKCNGCGLCVSACHEGAIQLVDGKATLVRDDYCDGLGDCLPSCPTEAISFIEREAAPYDEEAVIAAQMAKAKADAHASGMMPPSGCPGSMAKAINREAAPANTTTAAGTAASPSTSKRNGTISIEVPSTLEQWPVQIKLVPTNAPYFDGADLLIAADCSAFAYGNFHEDFIKGRITLIGCPKLDGVDYAEKLSEILKNNDIKSVTVARMQVPCCGGIEHAALRAIELSGKSIPLEVVTIASDGSLV